jgi:putative ABC transport system permease protein
VTLLKIAFRNVMKNRRRSLITMLAIGFGFMAVAMFRGYTHQAYEKIALGAIFGEVPGHLVLFKKGYTELGRIRPEDYLFTGAELRDLQAALGELPAIVWSAPKLQLTGLVSNGDVSTIFLSDAMDPADEQRLWDNYTYRQWISKRTLPAEPAEAILAGPELVRLLHLGADSSVVLMATTQYGQMNAVDATVVGEYATFADTLNDKYLRIPLHMAQALYDTDGSDRLCVLCAQGTDLALLRPRIQALAAGLGIDLEIFDWVERSVYYSKAKGFLDVVFLFLFSITGVIVVMGTVNTMSMAIYERTREIGTLRALGLKNRGVIQVFAFEGGVLGLLGSILGLGLTVVGRLMVQAANIRYQPPGIAESVQVEVDLVPQVLLISFCVFTILSVVSAALPARRATKQRVVDSLGHV